MAKMALVTGAQLRAARALLRMEQTRLAELAGVSAVTVGKLEGSDGPPAGRTSALRALPHALEEAGAAFTGGEQAGGPARKREAGGRGARRPSAEGGAGRALHAPPQRGAVAVSGGKAPPGAPDHPSHAPAIL